MLVACEYASHSCLCVCERTYTVRVCLWGRKLPRASTVYECEFDKAVYWQKSSMLFFLHPINNIFHWNFNCMDAFAFSTLFASAFYVSVFVRSLVEPLTFSLELNFNVPHTHTHVKITFHEQTVWNLWLENIFTKTSSSILYCVRASASVSFLIHAFYFGGWVFSVQRQRWRRHTFNQLCKCKCMNEEWMRFS